METPPLIGRELDLAVALEQLKRIEGGVPASLLVRGDAGIGKSRLVAELIGRAEQLGHQVLIGRADDLDIGIPYAIFRDVIARLSSTDRPDQQLVGLLGDLTSALDGDLGAAPTGETQLATVFARALRVFRQLGAAGPTAVVFEDVHLADRESLALVARLARLADVAMLTVVTLRPNAPGSQDLDHLLERMAFDGRGAVVDLQPLDRHESNTLVAAVLNAVPDDDLTEAVFTASRGNPFFACEVARLLVDAGAAAINRGRARLIAEAPALGLGLRPSTALLRRLFGGTSTDVELAKVMAVFGRFSLRQLPLVQRLVSQSADGVTASFDRLVKAGLLAATTGGGYEFTHSIVRDTLYEDIGPAERRRIHGTIAAELAKDRGSGMVLDVLELAVHLAQSAEPGDESAAEVLLEAGRAIAATAPLVSAEYQRRAADLLPAHSPRRAEALALQARALHLGSRPLEAAAVGRRALDELDPGSARRSTVAIVVSDLYLGGHVTEALDVVDAELDRGGDPGPLLAEKVNLLLQAGLKEEAAQLFPSAVDSVEAAPVAELMAFTHLIQYANHVGRVDAANDLLARLGQLTDSGSPTVQLAAHELIAYTDWRPGLAPRIERHLAAARRLRPQAALSMGGLFESTQARLYWLSGQWDEALELIRTASFDLEQREGVNSAQMLLCLGAEILIDRGALDEAAAVTDRVVTPIEATIRYCALAKARLDRAVGDRAAASQVLEGQRRRASGGGSIWKLAEVLRELAEMLIEDDRLDEAGKIVAEMEVLADTTKWPECRVAGLRARAMLDRQASSAWQYAKYAEQEQFEFDRAWALLLLGELDIDPLYHLGIAYKAFDTLGAAPLRRRTAAAMRARGLSVPRRPAQTGSLLTETEVQLVRLVRGGLSNRQIATAMNYSTKTIEVYLSRIYTKTGYASRLELIRAVDTGAVALPAERS